MDSFDFIWDLLSPKAEYANRKKACYELWMSFPIEQQRTIYKTIKDKLKKGVFVDYNPYFALVKNSQSQPPKEQTLSYNDYYVRYGTTEECDGWKMENPSGHQVIYVKQ